MNLLRKTKHLVSSIIFCICFFASEGLAANLLTPGNSYSNIVNGGFAAEYKGWIYYSDHGTLNKMSLDGKKDIQIANEDAMYINVVDNWIYYAGTKKEGDKGKLFKVEINGKNKILLSNDTPKYINVVDGWIYYCSQNDNNKIYKIRINGKDKRPLNNQSSENLIVEGDWIYYLNNSKIYKMKTSGESNKKIKELCDQFVIDSKYIFGTSHTSYGSESFRLEKDGSNLKILTNTYNDKISIYNEEIYFIDGKMTKEGTDKIYFDFAMHNFNISGKWLLYRINNEISYTLQKKKISDLLKNFKLTIDNAKQLIKEELYPDIARINGFIDIEYNAKKDISVKGIKFLYFDISYKLDDPKNLNGDEILKDKVFVNEKNGYFYEAVEKNSKLMLGKKIN